MAGIQGLHPHSLLGPLRTRLKGCPVNKVPENLEAGPVIQTLLSAAPCRLLQTLPPGLCVSQLALLRSGALDILLV